MKNSTLGAMKNPMNKWFAFLFLIAFSNPAFSQDLSLNVDTINLEFGEYIDYGEILLTNTGSSEIEVGIRLDRICYAGNDNSTITICFGKLCFTPTNDETSIWGVQSDALMVLAPSETSSQVKFTPSSNAQLGSEWSLDLFDRNNPQDRVTVYIIIDECGSVVSTIDIKNSINPAYPNPTTGQITIPIDRTSINGHVNILSATGKVLRSIPFDENEVSKLLDVSHFNNGVYFYYNSYTDGNHSPVFSFLKQE